MIRYMTLCVRVIFQPQRSRFPMKRLIPWILALVVSLSTLLAGWGQSFFVIDGQRYSIYYSVARADCDTYPNLKECGTNPPGVRVAVIVYRHADSEPEGERCGAAGSTCVEIGRFYRPCLTNFCRQDHQSAWVRQAIASSHQ